MLRIAHAVSHTLRSVRICSFLRCKRHYRILVYNQHPRCIDVWHFDRKKSRKVIDNVTGIPEDTLMSCMAKGMTLLKQTEVPVFAR